MPSTDIKFDLPSQGFLRRVGNGFETDWPVQVTIYGPADATITFRNGATGTIKLGQSIVLEPTGTVFAKTDTQGDYQAVFQPL